MKLEKNVLASYILQACKSNKCFTVSKPTTFCLSIGFHKMFLCHATLFVPPPKSRCVIFIQVSLPSKTYIKGMRIIPQAFVFSPPTSLRYITLYLMPWVQGLTITPLDFDLVLQVPLCHCLINCQLSCHIHMGSIPIVPRPFSKALGLTLSTIIRLVFPLILWCHCLIDYQLSCHIHMGTIHVVPHPISKALARVQGSRLSNLLFSP